MARGMQYQIASIPAMEMTKWFDTNYLYIVPEFEQGMQFRFASSKVVDEFKEAQELGIHTRPVLLGPVSFLLLGKSHHGGVSPLNLLPQLLPVYTEVLRELAVAGADWIQLDEPCLVLDLDQAAQQAVQEAYIQLSTVSPQLRLLLTTYFDNLGENLSLALQLPVAGLHLDLVRAPEQLEQALVRVPSTLSLSLGIIDGRNVWRTNLEQALRMIEQAVQVLGTERVLVAPSCSLLHVPLDLQQEAQLDDELRSWLAFAQQKLDEVALLTQGSNTGQEAITSALEANRQAFARRRKSPRIHNEEVTHRVQAIIDVPVRRQSPYIERRQRQQERFHLPLLPTTTIGSFPQTAEVRAARAAQKSGKLSQDDYPREQTCFQLALAIGDEVQDLEAARIGIIQIDEPALREGLPLRHAEWTSYLTWAINCFRLASSGVRDETQIHTHICYSEFNDIIEEIGRMDADVLSIEASRSQLELLDTFVTYHYPNEIGPGIYDIHSPRIPSAAEFVAILRNILRVLPPEQGWVNPDCGLNTRRWEEVRPALANLVAAASIVRAAVGKQLENQR